MVKLSSVTLIASALLALVLLTACGTSEEKGLTPAATTQRTTTAPSEGQGLTPAVITPGTTAVGIDADPTGNTATSLDTIDACVSVTNGQSFDIDVFVTDVSDLFGWDATFSYDGSVVHVLGSDAQLFQASNPGSQVVNFSADPFPDTDGSYTLGVGEMAEGSSDSGSGVLIRLTLEAASPGTSRVSLAGLKLRAMQGDYIGDADGDQFFDGAAPEAEIRVDEPCPSTGASHPDNGGYASSGFLSLFLLPPFANAI
jgi:hypothetical protein